MLGSFTFLAIPLFQVGVTLADDRGIVLERGDDQVAHPMNQTAQLGSRVVVILAGFEERPWKRLPAQVAQSVLGIVLGFLLGGRAAIAMLEVVVGA